MSTGLSGSTVSQSDSLRTNSNTSDVVDTSSSIAIEADGGLSLDTDSRSSGSSGGRTQSGDSIDQVDSGSINANSGDTSSNGYDASARSGAGLEGDRGLSLDADGSSSSGRGGRAQSGDRSNSVVGVGSNTNSLDASSNGDDTGTSSSTSLESDRGLSADSSRGKSLGSDSSAETSENVAASTSGAQTGEDIGISIGRDSNGRASTDSDSSGNVGSPAEAQLAIGINRSAPSSGRTSSSRDRGGNCGSASNATDRASLQLRGDARIALNEVVILSGNGSTRSSGLDVRGDSSATRNSERSISTENVVGRMSTEASDGISSAIDLNSSARSGSFDVRGLSSATRNGERGISAENRILGMSTEAGDSISSGVNLNLSARSSSGQLLIGRSYSGNSDITRDRVGVSASSLRGLCALVNLVRKVSISGTNALPAVRVGTCRTATDGNILDIGASSTARLGNQVQIVHGVRTSGGQSIYNNDVKSSSISKVNDVRPLLGYAFAVLNILGVNLILI